MNPYHDRRGRFTNAAGAATRTGKDAPQYGRGRPNPNAHSVKSANRRKLEEIRRARQASYRENATGEMPPKDFTIRGSMRLAKAQRLKQIKRGASLPRVTDEDLQAARRDLDMRVEMGLSLGASKTKAFKVLAKRYIAVRSHLVRQSLGQ